MQWENLTSGDFAAAVRETGVCALTLGVVEKHGEHLPLGTDYLNIHKIVSLAAEKESAVVFPPFYFGQIYEARCFPGTVTIKPTLLLELLQSVLDEIGRNGFNKIVLFNGHGGNTALLQFLAQCTLWKQKPYSVYLFNAVNRLSEERTQKVRLIVKTMMAHGCEWETSISLANHADLVKMENVPDEPSDPLHRLKHLPFNFSGIGWYSSYPEHYAGDARLATVEKGMELRDIYVEAFAEFIADVKADKVVPDLEREFFDRVEQVRENRQGLELQ